MTLPERCCDAHDECPKCRAYSPCVNHDEVDIGVGVVRGNFCFCCPVHGEYASTLDGPIIFRDEELPA